MLQLTPCPSCDRHVKSGSEACPFCGGRVPPYVPPRGDRFVINLTRAALMAGAAAMGCTDTSGSASIPVSAYGTVAFSPGFLPITCTAETYYVVDRYDGLCGGKPVYFLCDNATWTSYACAAPRGDVEVTSDNRSADTTDTGTTFSSGTPSTSALTSDGGTGSSGTTASGTTSAGTTSTGATDAGVSGDGGA